VVGVDLSLLLEFSACCLFYGLSRQSTVTNSIQIYFVGYYKSIPLESWFSMAFSIKLYSIRYNGGVKCTESLHFTYEDKVQD
jgi:hypothetical protein